jgi:hypothetical protein
MEITPHGRRPSGLFSSHQKHKKASPASFNGHYFQATDSKNVGAWSQTHTMPRIQCSIRCYALRRPIVVVSVALVVLVVLGSTVEFSEWVPALLTEETRLVRRAEGGESEPEDLLATTPGILEKEPEELEELEDDMPERNVTVIEWHGLPAMEQFINGYWEGNLFCETVDALRLADPHVPIQFQITFGCQELFEESCCGTGNFLGLFYGMRLAAQVYQDVEIQFTCHDAEQTRNHLILPWFTGVFPARSFRQKSRFPDLTPQDVCGGVYQQPVGHMIHIIQQELRHMAVSLVGRSGANDEFTATASYEPMFVPQLSPLSNRTAAPFADVELDDAVLHFRCGDLMDSTHSSFAFMNFRGYTRHISPDVQSIGILTQPFAQDTPLQRLIDSGAHIRDRCRTVVYSLVEYIQERFPQVTVRIHNEESIALTYSRMILAKQAISGISTFGVMPAVATFGTGYARIPDHPVEVNQWLLRPRIDTLVSNVVLIEDPKMPVEHIKMLWEREGEEGVLAWFRNDTWSSAQE